MRIVVEGGHELLYGRKDRDTEILKVEVSYLMPQVKKGETFKLVPTKIRDLRYGDKLAVKVSRKRLIVKRGQFLFVGQVPYRVREIILFDDGLKKLREEKILGSIIDLTADTKYKTIQNFLFKGVRPVEDISKQSRVHRDRKSARSKKDRKLSDVQSKRVRRKRRSHKAV